jgi:predicted ATP-dependent endonuclease of OLD family
MILVEVQVTNFRSVEDSGKFRIDQVTSLVGKNEAGKSAVLQALAALNPHPATPMVLDLERDYPRRLLTQYPERHKDQDAIAISTIWKLTDVELAEIESELGADALNDNQVTVLRRYKGSKPEFALDINFASVIKHLFDQFELAQHERDPLKASTTTSALKELLETLKDRTPKQTQLLEKLKAIGSATSKITSILGPALPRFMYFSNYDRMDGAIQVEQLQALVANNQINFDMYNGQRLFREFLDYAGVPLDEILTVATYETFNAKLQAASNNITDQILEYWTQNPDLTVEVRIESAKSGDPQPFNTGIVARARIYNQLHRVDTPFSERSAGFVWFFSFLVKFAQVKKETAPVVLLLDEPGLSLHGKAQGDLLRYFDEKLAPHHQIIYSTHSPFMVSADKLLQARIVEDQVEQRGARRVPLGTKVREDVLTGDPDTLFPLQGALGYEVTQSLFIGKRTLLVEGPSDILYLNALSSALAKRGRVKLDPRWTLCPSGGIGNIRSFMALFAGNKIDVAVLADYATGQKKQIESLRASDILKAGRVLTVNEFANKAEADVEDLFDDQLFAELLNSAYQLAGTYSLDAKKLNDADTTTVRLVRKAEAYFRIQMPSSSEMFDHFRPAEWLLQNPTFLQKDDPPITATLARAESLIVALNRLLND